MQLIQTVTVGSGGAASISFTSIPQTFTDLVLVHSLRTNRGQTNEPIGMTFNSNTANRTSRQLEGNGSSVFTGTTTDLRAGSASGDTATANSFGSSVIYIPNYAGSSAKTALADGVSETNASGVFMAIQAALWNDTTAINSITLTMLAGGTLFLQYSSASLYGITKGSDGTTTVS